MYRVIRAFRDATDGRFYPVGSEYPAGAAKPAKARIKSLLDGSNKNGRIYIEELPDETDTGDKGDSAENGETGDGAEL